MIYKKRSLKRWIYPPLPAPLLRLWIYGKRGARRGGYGRRGAGRGGAEKMELGLELEVARFTI